MSDILMAPQTRHLLVPADVDGLHEVRVTGEACALGNRACVRFELYDIRKLSGGKGHRMQHSVVGLRQILRQHAMRGVAVITHRRLTVTRFDPAIIFHAHDMTVQTGARVVGQVGRSASVHKSKDAETSGEADSHDQ